jgi:hypothetical protein
MGLRKGVMDTRKWVVKAYVSGGVYANAHYLAHSMGVTMSTLIEQLLREAVIAANGGKEPRILSEIDGQMEAVWKGAE